MFIYVFSEADRDRLLREGFTFVCEEAGAGGGAWVFLNKLGHEDALDGMSFCKTAKLCFEGRGKENDGGGHDGTENEAPF